MPRKTRKSNLDGTTTKLKTPCGNLYVTVNCDEGKPVEVLLRLGKSGQCIGSLLEGMARSISNALHSDTTPDDIIKALKSIHCPNPWMENKIKYLSCCDAIAQVLESVLEKSDEKKDK